ncbi:hypothetical protein [Jiella avicenniae]|uniref:Uncharacterized protein n=1 Tax=Jiella avicenniae TaxID=2907202 RepID=A0A9X1T9K2_9HYPH|nr:hypothetical protein [Jiella avicenniae]MCE7026398.1 hypothetical protein [Jiella avicenniae]
MDNRDVACGTAAPTNLLSRAQRDALGRLCAATYTRSRRGFTAPGQPAISLGTGLALRTAGAAEIRTTPGHPRLVATDLGRKIAGWQQDRRKKTGGGR